MRSIIGTRLSISTSLTPAAALHRIREATDEYPALSERFRGGSPRDWCGSVQGNSFTLSRSRVTFQPLDFQEVCGEVVPAGDGARVEATVGLVRSRPYFLAAYVVLSLALAFLTHPLIPLLITGVNACLLELAHGAAVRRARAFLDEVLPPVREHR